MSRFTRAILGATANGSRRFLGLWSPPTVAVLAGTVLTVIGLHMIYPPLAYMVPGVVLFSGGIWLAGVTLPGRRQD